MPQILPGFAVFAISCAAFAQQPQPAGFSMTDPQLLVVLNGISQHAAKIEPMLQEVRPNEWIPKGAPDTYVAQLTSTRQQLQSIQNEMSALAQHPDRISDCMKAIFRVEALHHTLDSLLGGLRKYQNPPLADLIESVAAEDRGDLERLQQYVLELANEKEEQFRVVDREAQRCRATLSRQPAEPARPSRRTP
jgi:hypothetical protein